MVPVKEKMKARCARQAPTNEEAMELPTEVTALANENEALTGSPVAGNNCGTSWFQYGSTTCSGGRTTWRQATAAPRQHGMSCSSGGAEQARDELVPDRSSIAR